MARLYNPGEFFYDRQIGGQEIYSYDNCWKWELEKGIYKSAGYKHWPKRVEHGEPIPGISIQKEILEELPALKDLLVNDKKQGVYRLLVDMEKAENIEAETSVYPDGNLTLLVIPISCFETVELTKQETLF